MKKLLKSILKQRNMKKICSLVGMMWLAGIVQAQGDYVPFPKSDAEWRVTAYNRIKYGEWSGGTLYHPLHTFGYRMIEYDTLIEGVQYPSIMLIYVPPGDDEYGYKLGYCAFREENKKVYVYMPGCGEQLLYDFSLKIGDTIFYTVSGCGNIDIGFNYWLNEKRSHYQVLVYIDTIELNNGEKRRRWHLSGGGGHYGGQWVEGIGDIIGLGLFEPFIDDHTWGGDQFEFTCFSQNEETIYLSLLCKDCDCRESPTHVIDIPPLGISIFPNPTSSQLRVTSYELQVTNIEIYDVVGKLLKSEVINLQPEIIIDISDLHLGLYFIKITTKENSIVKKFIKQ